MSYYCERLNANCKYCDEEDGCIFYSQGSGNVPDMPCYEADLTIGITKYDLLHKMSELCKENNISFRIKCDLLVIEWIGFYNSMPLAFSQCYSLFAIDLVYEDLDTVVAKFLARRDKELEKWKKESDNNG